jgi:SAM-dependent methyltransferase
MLSEIFLFILLLFSLLIVFSLLHFLLTGNTPPLITPTNTREKLLEIMDLNESSIFYDLGCGNGRFLIYLSKRFPKTEFVGIENSVIFYVISKIKVFVSGRKNVEIKFGNFLNKDISEATHLYMWIFVRDMDKLLEKFSKELKNGSKVYSLGFTFTDKEPTEVLRVDDRKNFARIIYIYDF